MLPRWHILFGAIFTAILWYTIPEIKPLYLALVFFSSFLIDFDHYLFTIKKTKKISLLKSFQYYKEIDKLIREKKKKGLREKEFVFVFHTIEFNILIALLGLLWPGFFFIFIGMAFHLLLDLAWMLHEDQLHTKEFFLTNWARSEFMKFTRN